MATDDQIETAARRRVKVLGTIREHIETHGYPPTLTELADLMDVDRETIKVDVRTLEAGGYLEVDKGKTRGLRITGYRVALIPAQPTDLPEGVTP